MTMKPALALILSLISIAPAASAQSYVYQPLCEAFAMSPAFPEDRTAFCVTNVYVGGSPVPSGSMEVWRTNDGGSTWMSTAGVGLQGFGIAFPNNLLISPDYSQNHTLYVQVIFGSRPGLYRSTDDGDSFLPIDPLADWGGLYPSLTITRHPLALPEPLGASNDAFAYAASTPALITPPLHRPVVASVGAEMQFVLPPSFPEEEGYLIARQGGAPSPEPSHVEFLACDANLLCEGQLFSFESGWAFVNAGFVDGVLFVALNHEEEGWTKIWRSSDRGRTFEVWKSVQALLPNGHLGPPAFTWISIAVDDLGHYYMRISYNALEFRKGTPAERFFVSADSGRSWKQVASGLGLNQRGVAGDVPWIRRAGPKHARGDIYASDDGRLFVLAESIDKNLRSYIGPFCSTDGARTWAKVCGS